MKEQTTENKPAAVEGARKARAFPKQAGETPDRWLWVERSVWTERMLNRLAKSQEQTVWFSLWDKVWNSDNLSQAMLEVIYGSENEFVKSCGAAISDEAW